MRVIFGKMKKYLYLCTIFRKCGKRREKVKQVSGKYFQSYGAGVGGYSGGHVGGMTSTASSSNQEIATYSGWNSLKSTGTGSFATIHDEVITTVVTSEDIYGIAPARRAGGRPKPGDTGYTPPVGSEMPVGDMLLPMLMLVGVYVGMRVRKFICKHKKIQSL